MQVINRDIVKEYMVIMIGMLIVAGAISGLSMVLVHFFPISMSTMIFLLNIFCLAIGFFLVGRDFGGKTVLCTVLLPLYLRIFEVLFPKNQSLTKDSILDALCFIVIASAGQAILFHANVSSGGLDIIAKVLNKYFRLDLGTAVAFVGMLIVASSVIVYDTRTLAISALGTYFNGILLDGYVGGFSRKKNVTVNEVIGIWNTSGKRNIV